LIDDLLNTISEYGVYKLANSKSIVVSSQYSSREDRKEVLRNLSKELVGSKFFDDNRSGYVKINGIRITCKPSKNVWQQLKPNILGDDVTKIVDQHIQFSSYYQRLINAIETTPKLNTLQKEYLTVLTEHTNHPTTISLKRLQDVMVANVAALSINSINNDFGEALGPLAIVNRQLISIEASSASILIPASAKYPLLDYTIEDRFSLFRISAKSGMITNTLKPRDLLSIVHQSKALTTRYRSTLQYQVMKLIDEYSIKQGPLEVAMFLKKRVDNLFDWIDNTAYTDEKRYRAECSLVVASKTCLDFTSIFIDALKSYNLFYVKFMMDSDGNTQWRNVQHQPLISRVVFRNKNGKTRISDKLGLQT